MGRGGEQATQASLNREDMIVLPPIPSQDDRSIDPQVSNLCSINSVKFLKELVSQSFLAKLNSN